MTTKKNFIVIAWLVFATAAWAQPYPGKTGVVLDGIGGPALELPNVTPTASAWQSVANSGQAAAVDSAGWPAEDFRAVFFDHRPFNAWNNAPDDPARFVVDVSGTYSLSFKGQATLTSWSDAPVVFQNKLYDPATNTTTVDIVFPSGGGANQNTLGNYGFLMINFLQTNYRPGVGGVKQIRLTRPGYQHNTPQLFRTAYVNALNPFSVIRYMPFTNTNSVDVAYPARLQWNDRQQPDAPRYADGAPWELVAALANYTGRDAWINIPASADSNYIVGLARYLKNTLRPDINLYLEYSNEVWNGSFPAYQYNYDAVLKSPEDADIRAGTQFDDRRRARRAGKQIIAIGRIFEREFGVSIASRSKLRPVFAWQVGGWLPWYDDVLTWMNTAYGPPKNYIYAIASAPYFGQRTPAAGATPEQVVAAMSAASDSNLARVQTLAQYAAQWGLKHIRYEGGPDNGGGSTVNLGNRIAANRIPAMGQTLLHDYRDNWFAAAANGSAPPGTNDLACHFAFCGPFNRWGCWGVLEDLKDTAAAASAAPKYNALCVLSGLCGGRPTIALTAPANNATIAAGSPVTITATAGAPNGSVARVEFFAGPQLIGADTAPPYSVEWAPTVRGTVAVLARAVTDDGRFTVSDPTLLNVVNLDAVHDAADDQSGAHLHMASGGDGMEIWLTNPAPHGVAAEVWDAAGRLITRQNAVAGTNRMPLNTNSLFNGVYILTVKSGTQTLLTQKIVLNR